MLTAGARTPLGPITNIGREVIKLRKTRSTYNQISNIKCDLPVTVWIFTKPGLEISRPLQTLMPSKNFKDNSKPLWPFVPLVPLCASGATVAKLGTRKSDSMIQSMNHSRT